MDNKCAQSCFPFFAALFLGAVFPAAIAFSVTPTPLFPLALTDATGERVVIHSAPTRIVTLAPSLGELAADLLGEDIQKIVGVAERSDYPPALKKSPSIGPYFRFNIEKVAALKPDLVIATTDGNPKDAVLHLRELKIPVLTVKTSSLRDIETSFRLVGEVLGAKEKGIRLAERFHQGIENVRQKGRRRFEKDRGGQKREGHPRVLLQVGDSPLVVVGKKSFLNELLEVLGATNVYADLNAEYPRPAFEDAVSRDPDVLLVLAMGNDPALTRQALQAWYQFPSLVAVRMRRVQVVSADSMLRPTMRLLEGISILEKAIYGQR